MSPLSATTPVHAIEVNNLQFSYPVTSKQSSQPASSPTLGINHWQVEAGEQIFLYGASGSGKSTLLNLISGILTPQQGSIHLLGENFSGGKGALSSAKRDAFRAKHIGVVFQEFNLIPFLTIAENIELASYFANNRQDKKAQKQRMTEIFERLQLHPSLMSQRADRLSVGQRQRVSIARALVNEPEILIADEPTSALDTDNRDEFMQLLLETAQLATAHPSQNKQPCTILFVSHDKGLAEHFQTQLDISELLIHHPISA